MRFGKIKMFFFLNGFIALLLLLYFGSWWVSNTVVATIVPPYNAATIHVKYEVEGAVYTGTHLRNGLPFAQKQVVVHYFILNPSLSRVHSYLGLYAEPLGWWLVFLIASAMLLLMPNTVFSKGTIFQLQRKFPWISMDEYFPAAGSWHKQGDRKNRPPGKKPKTLDRGDAKTLTS